LHSTLAMRLVVGALAIFLTSSVFADDKPATNDRPAETKPARPKLGLRLIRILSDTHQAVLLDRSRSAHIVASIGDTVAGYTVEDIDEDEVTLSRNGSELVLALPDPNPPNPKADTPVKPARAPEDPYAGVPSWIDETSTPSSGAPSTHASSHASAPPSSPASGAPSSPASGAPSSPASGTSSSPASGTSSSPASGASSSPVSGAPSSPVSGTSPSPVSETASSPVSETESSGAPSVASSSGPVSGTARPGTSAGSTSPPGESIAPLAASATSAPPTPPLAAPTGVLTRREVNAALADFSLLTTTITGAFTPTGAQLDAVASGSLFAKAGLRGGDLVASVNGRPLRSLDDAADLYARASTARAVTLQVVRAGKPTTLRITIQ
jgi:type II secretory pathway component PulC